ncbi:hypothetical protein BH20VER2_BH20VER2_17770 [soil metagenome]
MKRILLALVIFALVLPAAPQAEARIDASINFFYDNLRADDGYWLDVDGYGYCWQPRVAVRDRGWRPYADGYWAHTNVGWTWVSYEPFGWATYHYGRWARLRSRGWVWVPGYEWGPSWVSWRTGGNYVGWAPLPPRRYAAGGEIIYTGRAFGNRVDIEFDIGPSYYNFVNVRYIGAPVLSRHIYAPTQNITYINQTVNITNISYQNNTVYNYGPDYNRLNAYSTQPIQQLSLQRSSDIPSGDAGSFSRVQGNQLIVAAPAKLEQSQQRVAPPAVKEKVQQPDLETGWADVADANAKQQLQEKMKTEDVKSIPPPEISPSNRETLAGATPGAIVPADTTVAPVADAPGRGRGRGRSPAPGQEQQPAETAGAPGEADTSAPAADTAVRGRGRDKRPAPAQEQQPTGETAGDAATAGDDAASAAPAADTARRGRGRDRRPAPAQEQQPTGDAATAGDDAASAPATDRQTRGRGQGRQGRQAPQQPSTPAADAAPDTSAGAVSDALQVERRGLGTRGRGRQPAPSVSSDEVTSEPVAAPPQTSGDARERNAPRGDRGRGRSRPDTIDEAPAVQQQPAARPDAEQGNEERGNRGRGRRADRAEAPPAVPPPPQAAPEPIQQPQQPPMERPQQSRRERPQPPPQAAPPQAAPQGGGEEAAAPRQERGRDRPDKGKGKKDDSEQPEE